MSTMANWKNQILLVWVCQLLMMSALSMSVPFWPLFIDSLTTNQTSLWIALVYNVPLLAAVISAPLWGRLGDRFGHKKMVLRAAAGLLITQGLIAIFPNPVAIVIFRLMQGIFAGINLAGQSYAVAITPVVSRGYVIGKLQSANAVGTLIGPIFGSMIATYFGYQSIFSISAVVDTIAFCMLFFGLMETPRKVNPVIAIKTTPSKNLFQVEKTVLVFLAMIVATQLIQMMFTPFFALFITEKLQGNDISVGILYSATGLSFLISAPFWGRLVDERIKQHKDIQIILFTILFVAMIDITFTAFAINTWQILMLRFIWGICLAGLIPILMTSLLNSTENSAKGALVGLAGSASKLGELIGVTGGVFMQSTFGFTTAIITIAVGYGLLACFTLLSKSFFATKNFQQNVAT